jgi:DNA (cytosine-5)-methyltransferase 1
MEQILMSEENKIRFVDLFCGIGGFRYAVENVARRRHVGSQCVFSSDIDRYCQQSYEENFGERPGGDITLVDEKEVPDHDLLIAGFPCQPFSIIGKMHGFRDTRGTLFFDIARILAAKKPSAFVLENVKLLRGHDNGRTLKTIMATLDELGYHASYRVLNALNFGLPQKRERIWIVGFRKNVRMCWPIGGVPMRPLKQILEKKVDPKHYASDYIRTKRHQALAPRIEPTIWHENKAGNISAYPFSCALRAGASYNYLLVNGERRLTPREMLRLQGFPESFKMVCGDSQTRKQAGNSLPVNVATAVLQQVFVAMKWGGTTYDEPVDPIEMCLLEEEATYCEKTKIKNR